MIAKLGRFVNLPGVVGAILLNIPAFATAWNDEQFPIEGVLIRFLIATVVVSLGWSLLMGLIHEYERHHRRRKITEAYKARLEAAEAANRT